MKKFLQKLSLACLAFAGFGVSGVQAQEAATVDHWEFHYAITDPWTAVRFDETDVENVYKAEGVQMPKAVNFCIYGCDANGGVIDGNTYGWNEAVTEVDKAFKLGYNDGGQGWFDIAAGVYDITFDRTDAANATITFSVSDSQGGGGDVEEPVETVYYLRGDFNQWNTTTPFELKKENGIEVLAANVEITDDIITDGVWKFVVTRGDSWANSDVYYCMNTISNEGDTYQLVDRVETNSGDALCSLPAGTYEFKLNDHAWVVIIKRIGSTSITGIESEAVSEKEYYTMQGMKVSGENLTPGIYIVKEGKNVKKMLVK